VTISVGAAAGVVTASVALSGPGSNGDSLNVQIKAELSQVVTALSKLEFEITNNARFNSPTYSSGCAASATKQVAVFLAQHQCKEYASTTTEVRGHGIVTPVVVSWVVMPTRALASMYESLAYQPESGNPPGQPPSLFPGSCYASGQDDETVWAEQVHPTGHVDTDRKILQAMAPVHLTAGYLNIHCIG
jgi:hypothetical protein